MQYIPCINVLLTQETLLLSQKSTLLPHFLQKVPNSRQILISRQNSLCKCLKFSSKSKLFGEGPSCLRTTFATLLSVNRLQTWHQHNSQTSTSMPPANGTLTKLAPSSRLWCHVREKVTKKGCCSFGCYPNEGGGPAQIFYHLFISAFLVNKSSLFPPKWQ